MSRTNPSRSWLSLLLLFSVILAVTTCGAAQADTFSITFKSKRGSLLATGEIALADKLPTSGKVQAAYRLILKTAPRTDKEVDWFFRLFEGRLKGKVEWVLPEAGETNQAISRFNFMPGTADANIFAAAKIGEDGIGIGSWSYSIFAGGWEGGAFEIKKQ